MRLETDRYKELAGWRIGCMGLIVVARIRNLMAKDEFKNLGFAEESEKKVVTPVGAEEGKKGELRW